MLSNIKTKVRRYFELSWSELTQLSSWIKLSPSRNHVNNDTFAAPSLCVATATDEQGNAICHTLLETVIFVSAFAMSPGVTQQQAQLAGDRLDAVIGELGAHLGISKYLVICSADALMQEGADEDLREIKNIRLFERVIPQATAKLMLGYQSNASADVKYIN
jgi:hypothetical protein